MFKIYGGHEKFTQWTKDQKLIMSKLPVGAEILFYNDPAVDDPLITEVYEITDENGDTIKVCDVPNILLTEAKTIKVRIPDLIVARYGVHHKYVGLHVKYFEVEAAEKPSDYVYEETETEGTPNITITDEQVESAVKKYMDENDIDFDGNVSENDVATNEEVEDMLDGIFGT